MGSFTLSLSQKYDKKVTFLRDTYYPDLTDEDAKIDIITKGCSLL
jgi:hypothetical protein